MNLYTIVFTDKTVFEGGDLKETKWLNIPNKDISTIFYNLPTGDVLCLSNFKRIYHCVDGTVDIIGENKGKPTIEFSHIFVDRAGEVLYYKIDLRSLNINIYKIKSNDKILLQLNPKGWKYGKNK